MVIIEGKAPRAVDEAARKYLLDKLSETRKSCEWLVTLGAANVFGNLLKLSPPRNTWLRPLTVFLVGIEMLLALAGAMAWLSTEVDAADYEKRLKSTLYWRYAIRNGALILLVASFILLSLQIL